jgi:hypothetical protein
VLDADVMVRALGHQLVLDLDRREAGRFRHLGHQRVEDEGRGHGK